MRSLAILVLVLPLLPSIRGAERDIARTFPARPGCSLQVETFRGAITITEADTAEVSIRIHLAIGADDPREAERLLEALQLDLRNDGAAIRVLAHDPQQSRARFVWDDKKQLEPTFRITVPRRCDLELHTRNGAIIVGNVEGKVRARTEAGDVFFRHIRGSADGVTSAGDVVISHCDGTITAETRLGGIRIGVADGPCVATSASGDVEIQEAKSDVRVYAEAGTAAVTFARDFAGRAEIRTSGGPILAALDPRAACDIDASTSLFAHIYLGVPLSVRSGKSGSRHLVAAQNGGGHPIALHASGGDVKIVRGTSLFDDSEPVATR